MEERVARIVRSFVELLALAKKARPRQDSSAVYVGVDPGVTGAIGFVCGAVSMVIDLPTTGRPVTKQKTIKEPVLGGPKTRTVHETRKDYDLEAIVDVFRALDATTGDRSLTCVEKAQVMIQGKAGNSAWTAYEVGVSYGLWPLFLTSRDRPFLVVEPAAWKRELALTGHDKDASRMLALSMWPDAPLKAKKHHNRAEALLLAEYARRQDRARGLVESFYAVRGGADG